MLKLLEFSRTFFYFLSVRYFALGYLDSLCNSQGKETFNVCDNIRQESFRDTLDENWKKWRDKPI